MGLRSVPKALVACRTKGAHLLMTTYVQAALYTGTREGWTVLLVQRGVRGVRQGLS